MIARVQGSNINEKHTSSLIDYFSDDPFTEINSALLVLAQSIQNRFMQGTPTELACIILSTKSLGMHQGQW